MIATLANLRIGSKLLLIFLLLMVGFALMFYLTLESFAGLQQREALEFTRSYQRVSDVKELRINIMNQRIILLLAMQAETPPAERSDVVAEIQAFSANNTRLLAHLRDALEGDGEGRAVFESLEELRGAYVQTRDNETLPLLQKGDLAAARELALGIQAQRMQQIHRLGQQLAELTERRVQETLAHTQAALHAQRQQILWRGALLVLLGGVLASLLSRHIAQPLAQLTGWAERISGGEIPRELLGGARQDEVGRLSQAFDRMGQYLLNLTTKAENLAAGQLDTRVQLASEGDVLGRAFATMVGNLRGVVLELNEGIAVLASSSEEILAATTQVASSTQETATAISEIATTVEEVKQTAILAGNKSQLVAESTERTRQVAYGGRQSVEEALKGMSLIREQMQAVAESIMRLGEQSQTIGEIVASVSDLAEQSNLLGVNASIEAVKAGEVGKGFSVVAQEVKALADQSKQATAQVRGILGEIQKAMTRAVLLAEQGSKSVESGYARAQVSGEAIRTLGDSIEESSEMALQIAATSQQQMIGMDQIASAMESIRQASQDNVGGTRQVDLAARNLHQLGSKLQGLAGQFKL
ncbi:MAG: methyl-accepting chemotaxis protein [Pseudomonas sp.]|uniref:methyl-accepting chemotaxis protein n=1 Tax=Pseudomonas sp. TaxID=306 RepID=UPI0033937CF5